MEPTIALITKPGGAHTGVGRYAGMLHTGLRAAGVDARAVAPAAPPLPRAGYALLRRGGLDLRAFLMTYPIWARYPRADVYHFTSQNLASLLLLRRPAGRVVVTVHDIIPYMLRDDSRLRAYHGAADRLLDRMAMAGLRRADQLIADSQYTKECVVRCLGIAPERIDSIPLAVAPERFTPLAVPASIGARFGLPEGQRYLIYVGSEDPRKNLDALIRALAEVRRHLPDVELIKVGRAHFAAERERLRALATQLDVLRAIHFLDDVAEDDLPVLYNLAELCVMPSLYEGFGLPVLEAQSCGTPVVCADASSLPEVAGGAALLVACQASAGAALGDAIARALNDHELRRNLRARGLTNAAGFTWARTVGQTIETYRAQANHPGRPRLFGRSAQITNG
jgi:glycosyltransferase involved in cell wall biosynthesis